MNSDVSLPLVVPVLSAGRHRNPRKGACFMEMASFLAGERWSDHPRCTHPLLAGVARLVNDSLADGDRALIAPLIPAVIGINGVDPVVDARIALRCAVAALPVAPQSRQNVLAVAVLVIERWLDQRLGRPAGTLAPSSRAALDAAPDAERWARKFGSSSVPSNRDLRGRVAPHTVTYAVDGLAEACTDRVPERLVALLEGCIAEAAQVLGRPVPAPSPVVETGERAFDRKAAVSRG